MDADRHAVVEGIADLMNVADARRNRFHMAWVDTHRRTCRQQRTVLGAGETLRIFSAAQHADQPPDPVIVDGRLLPRPPDKADDGEALA
ncbi:hypothetical protein D3C76_1634560 [compost metagenome]